MLASLLLLGLALAAEPSLDQPLPADAYAVRVERGAGGVPVVRSALVGDSLWRGGTDRSDIHSLCQLTMDDAPSFRATDATLVLLCSQAAYDEVVGSVAIVGAGAPWHRHQALRPSGSGFLHTADGSQLLRADGATQWEHPAPRRLATLSALPTGAALQVRFEGPQVFLDALSAAGATEWTTLLPVIAAEWDVLESGAASERTLFIDLVPYAEGGGLVVWSDFEVGGRPWARAMVVSDTGEVVASHRLPYEHGTVVDLPSEGLVAYGAEGRLHVLRRDESTAARHQLGGERILMTRNGRNVVVQHADRVQVFATPSLTDRATWTTLLERPLTAGESVRVEQGLLLIEGPLRIQGWTLSADR